MYTQTPCFCFFCPLRLLHVRFFYGIFVRLSMQRRRKKSIAKRTTNITKQIEMIQSREYRFRVVFDGYSIQYIYECVHTIEMETNSTFHYMNIPSLKKQKK